MIAELDRVLLHVAASGRNPLADHFFIAVTWLGSLWVLLPASLALGALRVLSSQALTLLSGALLLASATSHLLKVLIDRDRPRLYESLISMPGEPSFPSSHSTQAAAFAVMIALLLSPESRNYALPALVVTVLLVGWSRVHLQVHWPSDVLAGWLLGGLVAALVWYGFGREGLR